MRIGVTDTPVLSLAGPVLSQAPNEHRQVCQMSGRDLDGSGQMFEAIRLDGPRRVIGEDVADPSLLGTGEHGRRYRSRTAPRGPVRASSPSRVPRPGNRRRLAATQGLSEGRLVFAVPPKVRRTEAPRP